MKTPAERGLYGRWLVEARQFRSLTQAQAREALAEAGVEIAPSVYAEYEAGSKTPSRTHLPLLADYWGAPPEQSEPPETAPDLVTAITTQTAAIDRLVDRLDRILPSETFDADQAWAAISLVLRQRPVDEKDEVRQALDAEQARLANQSEPPRSGRHGTEEG